MPDNNYRNQNDGCMDWGDTIEQDNQFVILPEGDYTFTVTKFERARHAGSEKIPPCNKALLTLEVKTPEGTATVLTDLLLYRTMEWKISSFFRAIGQKKQGEGLVMDWSRVIGARGRAHIAPATYVGKQDGREHEKNEVVRYYDYDPSQMPKEDDFMTLPEGSDDELPFN